MYIYFIKYLLNKFNDFKIFLVMVDHQEQTEGAALIGHSPREPVAAVDNCQWQWGPVVLQRGRPWTFSWHLLGAHHIQISV